MPYSAASGNSYLGEQWKMARHAVWIEPFSTRDSLLCRELTGNLAIFRRLCQELRFITGSFSKPRVKNSLGAITGKYICFSGAHSAR